MAAKQQVIRRLSILLLLLANDTNSMTTPLSASSKEDLDEAEANGKLEIVKQIKKVNDDGSYTIGYEADDGTFKIESRDVLGNIKGTYGYIDEKGEIKRVSYSTNNGSNSEIILPKADSGQSIDLSGSSGSSVVQRIPKINKTQSSSTTRRPSNILYHSTATNTPATPASSSTSSVAIQSIPKRRMTTTTTSSPFTTTTDSAKISDFIKAAVEASKSPLNRVNIYKTSSPRILLQQKSSIRTEDTNQRSEGQILRPDVVPRPTELPIYTARRNDDGEEVKSNLLRRQLQPEPVNFDSKNRPLNSHQSQGDGDVVDVYGSSFTASTTRPLFTTLRPKFVSSSTLAPTIQRPTIRYPSSKSNQEYEEETSTENIPSTTLNSVPVVVQSPTNTEPYQMQGPLVAIKHPLNGRTILVPLGQLQQMNRYDNEDVHPVQSIYMSQSQRFRPIQVRIDENGYVRQMPQYHQAPYSIPVRVTPAPRDYLGEEDEINLIKPPVSTRDFQKLLDQLILRQSRLEQISALTKRYQQTFGQRNRPLYHPNLLVYPRQASDDMNAPYVGQNLNLEQQNMYNYQSFTPTPESYTPTRRVARLLTSRHLQNNDREDDEDYLPPDVREMLLLRMLQLAINPSLPLNIPDNFEEGVSTMIRHRKMGGARNVEILGEEDDTQKLARSKR
ncbi:hypothetical protein Trydic_g6701 [Trypoxylus dichotomus]